jgi:hypothetical protein
VNPRDKGPRNELKVLGSGEGRFDFWLKPPGTDDVLMSVISDWRTKL